MKKMIKRKLSEMRNSRGQFIMRACTICGHSFKARSNFRRFCNDCKRENEVYLMAEWLPDAAIVV